MLHKFPRTHNSTRNFSNMVLLLKFELPTPTTCLHCHAQLFYHESRDMCCSGGKVLHPRVPPPHELLQIFSYQTYESRHFRQI